MRHPFFVILILATIVSADKDSFIPGSRYQAALCIWKHEECTPEMARLSTVCQVKKFPWQQTALCRKRACDFCKYYGIPGKLPCSSDEVKYVCKYLNPNNNNSTRKHNHDKCVWTDKSGSIIIDLSKVKLAKGWTHITHGKYHGIIYEQDKVDGIDPAGTHGRMCFKVLPKYSGSYFFSAISNSPHTTEHNDCWVSSSKGFRHYKGNNPLLKFTSAPRQWLKAYQNKGPSGMSDQLFTKDHDAHTFVIPNVNAGEKFTVCISGRSYKYEMFRLVLISCGHRDMCHFGNIMNKPVSPCM